MAKGKLRTDDCTVNFMLGSWGPQPEERIPTERTPEQIKAYEDKQELRALKAHAVWAARLSRFYMDKPEPRGWVGDWTSWCAERAGYWARRAVTLCREHQLKRGQPWE